MIIIRIAVMVMIMIWLRYMYMIRRRRMITIITNTNNNAYLLVALACRRPAEFPQRLCVCGVYMCIYTYPCAYVYMCGTPSPPTKSLDFRGCDSSRLLILRGGNSHVRIIL